MQHTLLGLALALIAAIVAAFAAPLFVDWDSWRPEFEQRAAALMGAPVAIRGPIEAKILPTPAFVMRDVTVGDAARGTGLKAGEIRGILSLGALFRGAVEADELVLTKPMMRVALGADGRVILGQAAGSLNPFSVSRFTVEGGMLTVEDRASGRQFQFNDVAAAGELQSRSGPVKIDASFSEDGKPRNNTWKLRAATGQFGEDGKGKLRAVLTRADGFTLDADGSLALAKALPRFEGKLNLSQPGAFPWKLAANAEASDLALKLDDLSVSLGAADAPAELSGWAQIASFRHGRLDAELSGKFLDLDRAAGGDENRKKTVAEALAPLRDLLAGFRVLPLSGAVKVEAAQVVAGGGNIRDLSSVFSLRDGIVAPEKLQARLPGRASIDVRGASSRDGNFKGQWAVSAEEPAALAEWSGLLPPDLVGNAPFKLDGGLSLSEGKVTFDPFLLSFGKTRLGGDLVYESGAPNGRAHVSTKLNGSGVDMALLAPLIGKVLGRDNNFDLRLALDVQAPRVLEQTARRLNVSLARKAEGITIERFSLEDAGGLNATAQGEIASYAKNPKGRVAFTLDASDPKGLNDFAAALLAPEAAAYIRRVSDAAMPLHLAGTLTGKGSAETVAVEAKGNAGGTQVALASDAELQPLSLKDAKLALDAPDASSLVAQLGLPAPEPQAGQGHFELALGKKEKGVAPLKAHLVFPGIDLAGDGVLRFAEQGGVEPRVNLKLAATDLRALSVVAARASDRVVPANGTARLIRIDGGMALEDLALDLGGDTRIRGRVKLKDMEQPALSGELSVNRSELSIFAALALGHMGEGAPWSDAPLGAAPLAGLNGDFDFESAALGLGGNLAATGVRGKFRFGRDQVSIDDLTGDIAGGKLKAHARISRPDLISFDGGFSLQNADVARILSPENWRSSVHGTGNIELELAGQGASPAQLAGNIAGRGKYSMEPFEVEKLAAGSLAAVVAATAKGPPPDEANVRALLAKALDEGPLKIAKLEGPIVAANGVVRAGKTTARVKDAEVNASAALDLARLTLDVSVGLENSAPKGVGARPAATVVWRGPVAEPARSLEIAPLMAMISLRAVDAEMKRINERERTGAIAPPLVPSLATEAAPPASPSVHAPKPKAQARPKPQPQPSLFGGSIRLDPIH